MSCKKKDYLILDEWNKEVFRGKYKFYATTEMCGWVFIQEGQTVTFCCSPVKVP